MNYWGAESTALPECHEPLLDFVSACAEPCRIATRKAFGQTDPRLDRRTSQNIFGGNGWEWNIPASAWYAQHMAEHYAFTQDKEFLRKQGYPMVKEICQYWEDRLKKLPDGTLVAPDGWSPEHGPREDGVMHDQQIIWDLFQNYREMAQALGVDADYQAKVADMQAHLAPNKIGTLGPTPGMAGGSRRGERYAPPHLAPLCRLSGAADQPARKRRNLPRPPSRASRPAATTTRRRRASRSPSIRRSAIAAVPGPGLGAAASGPAWARPSGRESWSADCSPTTRCPTCSAITRRSRWTATSASTGAIPEMLLQSHAGEIALLPACPAGVGQEGLLQGLRARGGYRVDCAWKDGKVTSFHVVADKAPDKSARSRCGSTARSARSPRRVDADSSGFCQVLAGNQGG